MAMSEGWIARGGHTSKLKWSILELVSVFLIPSILIIYLFIYYFIINKCLASLKFLEIFQKIQLKLYLNGKVLHFDSVYFFYLFFKLLNKGVKV